MKSTTKPQHINSFSECILITPSGVLLLLQPNVPKLLDNALDTNRLYTIYTACQEPAIPLKTTNTL